MSACGEFGGVGVGPGEQGLIPVVAWEFVKRCDVIFVPRARSMRHSVARQCLPENDIPNERFREVEFTMDSDRNVLREHYAKLAEDIATELKAGKNVAYLTIGDPLTYSTYIYTLAALKDTMKELRYRTYPGVTSYCALAAATDFPLGESKERVLVLPCPEAMQDLRAAIRANDLVVLMKIGERLPKVLRVLKEMGIDIHCAFGKHVGMSDQLIYKGVQDFKADESLGYLSTMLIRKTPAQKRHVGGPQL